MTMGAQAAERCDDFGWQPRGTVDPGLVAETMAHPKFGLGRAWSNSAGYRLAPAPKLTYLVYTVEGGFDFTVDGTTVRADPGSMVLFDGEAPVTARTTEGTARFVWYFEPTLLHAGRSRFAFHEPLRVENAPLRALAAMTHSTLDAPAPGSAHARRHLGIAMEHLVSAALEEAGGAAIGSDSRHRDGLFMAAQRSIETHFRDPAFTVARLATDLSVSVRTLHETFRHLGTTPRREIERRRVSEIDRITDGRMNATDLAAAAGFSSARQLQRALRRSAPSPETFER
ncbi:helix-turn-helix domain-containing protein [Plantibacter auratus]|uniref:helix-turn-helix domain-containing protein n=1 Tax=Plantibacter TaxID=190323 RepID=UPI00177B16A1|nr:AraC family transcriptional regulator [Plantibacter sp. CFBP 8798]MBD8464703.1 helix-turn-helix transcriptional regulator [Plantibacter sp. CFBP 8798]